MAAGSPGKERGTEGAKARTARQRTQRDIAVAELVRLPYIEIRKANFSVAFAGSGGLVLLA